MKISVLLSTYKRSDTLRQTLDSFKTCDSEALKWELIIADNADDSETQELIQEYKDTLPIISLVVTQPGKNAALNAAIKRSSGDFLIFTDDDVLVPKNWLKNWLGAIKHWKKYSVFGGKVIPYWPEDSSIDFSMDDPFIQSAFCIANWNYKEGEFPADKVWGPNMGIRKKIFEKYSFNEEIGPKGRNYIMGSETELTRRLEQDGFKSIFLPEVIVHHIIRDEQMDHKWIFNRAFRYGRADTFHHGKENNNVSKVFGVPRYLFRKLWSLYFRKSIAKLTAHKDAYMDSGIQFHIIRGQIYQYQQQRHDSQEQNS